MHAAAVDVAGEVGASVLDLTLLPAHGAAVLPRRAWAAPYVGPLPHLVVSVAVWGLTVAACRLTRQLVIHVLTGV